MKKRVLVTLTLSLLICFVSIGNASEISIMRADEVITDAATNVIVSGSNITARALIETKMTVSSLGFPTFNIQEKQPDGTWEVVKKGATTGTNKSMHSATLTYTKEADKKYRVYTKYKAVYNGTTYTASADTIAVP